MQRVVHDVEPDVARLDDAQNRVEVRSIAVHQAAGRVHQARDFANVLFEQADGVGVGQHHPGGARRELALEVLEVDIPARVAIDLDNLVADHGGGGGGGAVGRVGHQDPRGLGGAAVLGVGPEDTPGRDL